MYWVEGVYITGEAKKGKPAAKSEAIPFYRSFWAETPQEALRMAGSDIQGGTWVNGPAICKTSEEERMRAIGAPQLPFFDEPKQKQAKKKAR